MLYFTWDEQYSVNIRRMDEQHKKIFALFEDLSNAMQAGSGGGAVERVLTGLIDYAQTHFAAEEHLMQSFGYPGYDQHKRAHDDLKKQVKELHAQFKNGLLLPVKISLFLKEWLTTHIMNMDKQYSTFLNSKGVL